jgi:hypothetical protein
VTSAAGGGASAAWDAQAWRHAVPAWRPGGAGAAARVAHASRPADSDDAVVHRRPGLRERAALLRRRGRDAGAVTVRVLRGAAAVHTARRLRPPRRARPPRRLRRGVAAFAVACAAACSGLPPPDGAAGRGPARTRTRRPSAPSGCTGLRGQLVVEGPIPYRYAIYMITTVT